MVVTLIRCILTIPFILASACNDAELTGNGDSRGGGDSSSTAEVFEVRCDESLGDAQLVAEFAGTTQSQATVRGELCNVSGTTSTGQLTTLFIIDKSGSMEENDPTTAGECGRLQAARALVERLQAEVTANATDEAADDKKVDVGALSFSNTAFPPSPMVPVQDFTEQLTEDAFCGFRPGGATNYEAAFRSAQEILAGLPGQKVIYFISDGLPTASGLLGTDGAIDAAHKGGLEAARALRDSVDGVTINAVYLGYDPTVETNSNTAAIQDPETYLAEVTGSASRVKLVTSASDLASEILEIETPEIITIERDSVQATHVAARFGSNAVELARFEEDKSRPGVWLFETKPFDLLGESGKPTDNEIEITAKADDGRVYSARAVIRFTIQ